MSLDILVDQDLNLVFNSSMYTINFENQINIADYKLVYIVFCINSIKNEMLGGVVSPKNPYIYFVTYPDVTNKSYYWEATVSELTDNGCKIVPKSYYNTHTIIHMRLYGLK